MAFASVHEHFTALARHLSAGCKNPGCACNTDPESASGISVHCPCHDDERPSFWIKEHADRVTVSCKAGCDWETVTQTLRMLQLWFDPPPQGLTLEELAGAKHLSRDFLRSFGVYQMKGRQSPAVAIPYYNRDGDERAVHIRQSLTGDRFRWMNGVADVPYGLHKLSTILAMGCVIFVEGSSDVWTAWHHSLPAIGLPSADHWQSEWAAYFPEKLAKYIWCEDAAGWGMVDRILKDLPDCLVMLPPAGMKDLSDLHIADETKVAEIVNRMREAAKPASELSAERERFEAARAAKKALEQSAGLLDDPHVMNRIDGALKAQGLAGDPSGAKLLYLMLTSRFFRRPVNGSIEGPSSVGKNFLIDCTTPLFPSDAYYELTSSSPRAIAFSPESFAHRFVIFSEVSGLSEDGVGASIVRELVWRGRLRYEITEKTKAGTFETRVIVKDGPTGLLTTTTEGLESQLETRVFPILVVDTPEQTRLVVTEAARQAEEGEPDPDVSEFVAAQTWLATAGVHRVVIPFAGALASLVDVSTVRMRRDFNQILNLIRACAVLHQRQRVIDERGQIVATPGDYAIVWGLLTTSLASTGERLTPAQREAVGAVERIVGDDEKATASTREVADRLGVDCRAAHSRLHRPLELGYLVNQAGPNQRLKLRPGAAVPEAKAPIPSPAELEQALRDQTAPTSDSPETALTSLPPPPGLGNQHTEGQRPSADLPLTFADLSGQEGGEPIRGPALGQGQKVSQGQNRAADLSPAANGPVARVSGQSQQVSAISWGVSEILPDPAGEDEFDVSV